MSTKNAFTIVNQTGENILVAFISRMTGSDTYAWKVVGPSQNQPHIEPFPNQMELVTNYFPQGQPNTDPYGGKQTDSVWWDNVNRTPTTYRTKWDDINNELNMEIVGTNMGGADITLENNSTSMVFVHPKFGSNEYIPPVPLLPMSTVSYQFEWPMSVAVVDDYSQYSPPNGELYVVKNKLSDLSKILPGQSVKITGNLAAGYKLVVS